MAFDTTKAYKVRRYEGIAFRFHSWPKVWEPYRNEYDEESDLDGEWVEQENGDRACFHMVGDDHVFTFDLADVTPIKESAFCHSCGQIGCQCNVYE